MCKNKVHVTWFTTTIDDHFYYNFQACSQACPLTCKGINLEITIELQKQGVLYALALPLI